eukprot:352834-Chlamydomonas_euryale.AAC.18
MGMSQSQSNGERTQHGYESESDLQGAEGVPRRNMGMPVAKPSASSDLDLSASCSPAGGV